MRGRIMGSMRGGRIVDHYAHARPAVMDFDRAAGIAAQYASGRAAVMDLGTGARYCAGVRVGVPAHQGL
jgi:hypothetical protein